MPELPPVVAKLWGRETVARKGPRPRLDLETITAAAINLADAGGLAAVSMSSVAERVDVATMALYRYVGSKDELLTLMAEAALPPPPQHADPVANPVANPAANPAANPGAAIVASSVGDPVANPVGDPVANPVANPAANPGAAIVARSVGDPVANPVAPVANPVANPVGDPVANPVADPVADARAAGDGGGGDTARRAWRSYLATWTRANRDALLARPWLLSLPGAVPPIGPRRLAWLEAALAALGDTPLDESEKFRAVTALTGYALSDATLTYAVNAGNPVVDGAAGYGELLARVLDPRAYPVLAGMMRSGLMADSEGWVEDADFTFGLDLLLDGLEALIERRREI
ncbi:TetR/AcrR family transcriptional regulator [Flindersiella endophytica]